MPRTVRTVIEEQEVVTAPSGMSVLDAAVLLKEKQISALLVVEQGKLVGIFTERDGIVRVLAAGLDTRTATLADVMSRDLKTVRPDSPFVEALNLMHESGFRHVPVVDDGRPVGMVSARDALGPELKHFFYEFLRQEKVTRLLDS